MSVSMMAREHSESGIVMGLAAADITGAPLPLALVLTVLTAGAALLPDIDHPSATAARAFGPISRFAAAGIDVAGLALWHATASPADLLDPPRDGHRTATHTVAFAALAGALFAGLALLGRWPTLIGLFVLFCLAVRGLTHRKAGAIHVSLLGAALTAAAYFAVPGVDPLLIGECVALGCWTHCLGDSLTLYGCPWLWPIPLAGRRWYLIGTPRWMRFRTGTQETDGEDWLRRLMHVAVIALAIGLLPGAYPWLAHHALALVRH